METVTPPPVNLNILHGSFIGNLLTAVCFGVLTIQTSTYYHAFPNDRRPVKLVVTLLWPLEGFQLLVSPFLCSSTATRNYCGGLLGSNNASNHVRYTAYALPSLYMGGLSKITTILWHYTGRRGNSQHFKSVQPSHHSLCRHSLRIVSIL